MRSVWRQRLSQVLRRARLAPIVAATALLAACGGDSADVSILIVGQSGNFVAMTGDWVGCEDLGGGTSQAKQLSFERDNLLVTQLVRTYSAASDCSGAISTESVGILVVTTAAEKTVDWQPGPPFGFALSTTPVTRVNQASGNATEYSVAIVQDTVFPNVLYLTGATAVPGQIDTAGYPNVLLNGNPLLRAP